MTKGPNGLWVIDYDLLLVMKEMLTVDGQLEDGRNVMVDEDHTFEVGGCTVVHDGTVFLQLYTKATRQPLNEVMGAFKTFLTQATIPNVESLIEQCQEVSASVLSFNEIQTSPTLWLQNMTELSQNGTLTVYSRSRWQSKTAANLVIGDLITCVVQYHLADIPALHFSNNIVWR